LEPTPASTQALTPPLHSNAYRLLGYFLEGRFLALFVLAFLAAFFALRLTEALRAGRSSATAAMSITRLPLGAALRPRSLAASSCARWMASVTSRMYLAASASVRIAFV